MLIIIKSAPDTTEGKRGLDLAKEMSCAVVLLQNGVYSVCEDMPVDYRGPVYVLDDDLRLRGLGEHRIDERTTKISYVNLVDLMAASDKVVGMF
ncbi:MAG TPA: DsrH/TusB family sulfur metabolism protein [Dissulfurispiraceae bacterium]|nr:DsrH/TusB family sulfur metabolism protein [Dissulfurispiraceae bacterium]